MDTPRNKAASISATQELSALFEISSANRKDSWYKRLITCLPHALFSSAEPAILYNSSGLTYYNLVFSESIPDDGSSLTGYTIPELIDTFLINEGVGIVIEAADPERTIDLSYGDVLGFHLHRTFAEPEEHLFKTDKTHAHMIREGAELLINDVPSEILPPTSMSLLKDIMQHLGISDPKIKLLYLPETEQYELVFSIEENQFTPSQKQALIQKLGWFLPRYYSYLACDLNNISFLTVKH